MTRPPDCHPARDHVARGLCAACYRAARHAGTLHEHARRPSGPGGCITLAADRWRVTVPDLIGRSNADPLPDARADAVRAMAAAGMGWVDIGRVLDGRHRSTVETLAARSTVVPDPDRPPVADDGLCQVVGCDRPTHHMGLCAGHRHRWMRHGSLHTDRPLRDPRPTVTATLPDGVDHGTPVAYNVHGCGCQPCRTAAVRAVKRRRLAGPATIDVTDALPVVARLRAAGMTIADIARAAGLRPATIYAWVEGRVARVHRANLARVAAVTPPSTPPPTCELPGCPAEALAGGRWCLRHIAAEARAA